MSKPFIIGILAALLVHVSAQAATLTFDTGPGGAAFQNEVIDLEGDMFADIGILVEGAPNRPSTTLGLFNSDCDGPGQPGCSGNDDDLASGARFGTAPQGMVLILNGGSTGLNDDPQGGAITFRFTDPGGVSFRSFDLLDVDEVNPFSVEDILFSFEFADGSSAGPRSVAALGLAGAIDVLNLSSTGWTGDNSLYRYSFRTASGFVTTSARGFIDNVTAATIRYDGISGAVAQVAYRRPGAVPAPPAVALLATALAGGLCLRLRRRGAAEPT